MINEDTSHNTNCGIDCTVDEFLSSGTALRTLESTFGTDHGLDEEAVASTDIVTHCAKIYMSGGFAIKVKRPVSYSYLEMTNLSDRYKFLQRELEINQPHLPDVYLALCAVVLNEEGQLQLIVDVANIDPAHVDAEELEYDTVQEWCLVMRRFDQGDILDNIAQSGELSNKTIIALGNSIARYHKVVTAVPVDDGDARILEIIEELRHEFGKLGGLLPADLTHEYHKQGLKRFDEVASTLRHRGKDGFVRQCHGDLHLRNIVIHDGEPVPFDALEFDDRLRTIDTLYDLAFVLMDLDHRSLLEQENLLLNEYLLRTSASNVQAMDTLPLFMYCRAGIKAMTTAQAAIANDENRETLVQEARDYLQKGIDYLHDRQPLVVAIGGFSGSGKSTVARELPNLLCAAPGAILLRSDAERKAEFGVPETCDLGFDHYSRENSRRTYDRVLEKTELAAKAGYPVIVDATFLDISERQEVALVADRNGVDFFGFWLSAPVEVMRSRIEGRHDDASDAGVEILELQLEKYHAAEEWSAIDTTNPVSVSARKMVDHVLR